LFWTRPKCVALDFALVRYNEDGSVDSISGSLGATLTDMGGNDDLKALVLAPDGWIYAAGLRNVSGSSDFALAQHQPNGILATCTVPPCFNWSAGKQVVDWGGSGGGFAID
jgi:hypothetical protein